MEAANTGNIKKETEESSQSHSSAGDSDEWTVVDEGGLISSDEMIAKAAQLLGSALFHSDIISEVTEIKDDLSLNNVGSVPTDVCAIVSSAVSSTVLSRWDTELKQMHELGFFDDNKNVNALEHLEAVSMSVDSDDPITVNDAVDYLLSNYPEQI